MRRMLEFVKTRKLMEAQAVEAQKGFRTCCNPSEETWSPMKQTHNLVHEPKQVFFSSGSQG